MGVLVKATNKIEQMRTMQQPRKATSLSNDKDKIRKGLGKSVGAAIKHHAPQDI